MAFEFEGNVECIVHVRRLFETSSTFETVWVIGIMTGTRDPADAVVGIIAFTFAALGLVDELHAVVADHDCRCSALTGIGLHGLFERLARGCYRLFEGFLVDGHLDGDVGEMVVDGWVGSGSDCRVVFRVLMVLGDGTEGLGEDADDGHCEKLLWLVLVDGCKKNSRERRKRERESSRRVQSGWDCHRPSTRGGAYIHHFP